MRNLHAKAPARGWRVSAAATVVVLLAATGAAEPAVAADSPWGGAIGISSDNVYRGLSLSAGRPAWLADLHRELGPDWVAGLSASMVRPPYEGAAAELALYLQRGWQLADDWSLQAGAMHHEFPWNGYRDQSRYDELSLGIAWRGRLRATLTASPNTAGYAPGRYAKRGAAAWFELNFEQPLRGRLGANFGLGHAQYSSDDVHDYTYASSGLRYGTGSAYWYVSYIWSDLDGYFYRRNSSAGSRWVFSAIWTFP